MSLPQPTLLNLFQPLPPCSHHLRRDFQSSALILCNVHLTAEYLLKKTNGPVSYTHLDVYKRQILSSSAGLQSILEHLSTHQQADPKLISIITRLEAGEETVSQYYKIHNRILFSRPSLYKEEWKVIIPTHIEKEIVFNYHVRYGHMGALKVVKALEESCHIKDINRKVRKYIRNCRICQLVKTNNERRDCLLYTSRCV